MATDKKDTTETEFQFLRRWLDRDVSTFFAIVRYDNKPSGDEWFGSSKFVVVRFAKVYVDKKFSFFEEQFDGDILSAPRIFPTFEEAIMSIRFEDPVSPILTLKEGSELKEEWYETFKILNIDEVAMNFTVKGVVLPE